jgi:hypothetical protein
MAAQRLNAFDYGLREQDRWNRQNRKEEHGAKDGGESAAVAEDRPELSIRRVDSDGYDDAPRNEGKERAQDQKTGSSQQDHKPNVDCDFESATPVFVG